MTKVFDAIFITVGAVALIIGFPFAVAVVFLRFVWDYADYLYRVIDVYKDNAKLS